MGIPGVLNQIGRGERVALAKLAIEHLEATQRPLRIAIDAAIWNFQAQSGVGGRNPALRTLFYRLLRLLALPIHPLFVYDGRNKPLTKRGQTVSRYGTNVNDQLSQKLLQQLRFPYHTAPGEAEAECAFLQQNGLVDMVMSQDGDAIMFGSRKTLRNWSKEGKPGNAEPSHVDLIDLKKVQEASGLDPDGMILVALLSGGDYNQQGVPGFGIQMACDTARAGFGTDLLEAISSSNEAELNEWRERLNYELETNESGYFKKRHKSVKIPADFPDRKILSYYTNPAVSTKNALPELERMWTQEWQAELDIPALRHYVARTFEWTYKPGAWKLVRSLSRPLLANRLQNGTANQLLNSTSQLSERRQHWTMGGLPELRVAVTPADVVGLDLEAEEDSPDYVAGLENDQEGGEDFDDILAGEVAPPASSQSPKKPTKPKWNPFVPEKMWLLETQVELGAPQILEEWNLAQREKLEAALSKAKARKGRIQRTRSAPLKEVDRIDRYFATSKTDHALVTPANMTELPKRSPLKQRGNAAATQTPSTPTEKALQAKSKPLMDSSPDLAQYFLPVKPVARSVVLRKPMFSDEPGDLKRSRPSSSGSSCNHDVDLPVYSFSAKGSFENPIALTSSPAPPSTCSTELLQTPGSSTRLDAPGEASGTTPPLRLVEESVTQRKPRRNTRRKLERSRTEGSEPLAGSTPIARLQSPDISHIFSLTQTSSSTLDDSQDYELPQDLCKGMKSGFGRNKVFAIPRESLEGTWKEMELQGETVTPTSRRRMRVSCVNLAAD